MKLMNTLSVISLTNTILNSAAQSKSTLLKVTPSSETLSKLTGNSTLLNNSNINSNIFKSVNKADISPNDRVLLEGDNCEKRCFELDLNPVACRSYFCQEAKKSNSTDFESATIEEPSSNPATELLLLSGAALLTMAALYLELSKNGDNGAKLNLYTGEYSLEKRSAWERRSIDPEIGYVDNFASFELVLNKIKQLKPEESRALYFLNQIFEDFYEKKVASTTDDAQADNSILASKILKFLDLVVLENYSSSNVKQALNASVTTLRDNVITHENRQLDIDMIDKTLERYLFLVDLQEDTLPISTKPVDVDDLCPITLLSLAGEEGDIITDPVHAPQTFSLDALLTYWLPNGINPTNRQNLLPEDIRRIPVEAIEKAIVDSNSDKV